MNKLERIDTYLNRHKTEWGEIIRTSREMVLSNLAMLSQVPAQTFHEEERAKLILERYMAGGLTEPWTDSRHNVIGSVRHGTPQRRIMVFANIDHQFDTSVDPNVSFNENIISGAGVADDTLALSVLITLPDLIKRLGIQPESEIILMASTRSHGRGDFDGIRHYLKENSGSIDYAIKLTGTPIGLVNYFTMSRVRCDISVEIDINQVSPWTTMTSSSAIMVMNDVLNVLYSIPLPRQPKTVINPGMIEGGSHYSTPSRQASIHLEILSENEIAMEQVIGEINDRIVDVGAKHGVNIDVNFFGRHLASGLSYSHPLVKSAVQIVTHLGYKPIIEYSNSELAVPLTYDIPSVNIGISTGIKGSEPDSYVDLDPINDGILQTLMLISALDKGFCDE